MGVGSLAHGGLDSPDLLDTVCIQPRPTASLTRPLTPASPTTGDLVALVDSLGPSGGALDGEGGDEVLGDVLAPGSVDMGESLFRRRTAAVVVVGSAGGGGKGGGATGGAGNINMPSFWQATVFPTNHQRMA